jgi:hypothetical protein
LNRAAAGFRARIESFLQCGSVFCFAITGRAEVADIEKIGSIIGGSGQPAENQSDAEKKFAHHWTRRMLGRQNTCQLPLRKSKVKTGQVAPLSRNLST